MGEKIHVEEVPDVPTGQFYARIIKYEPYEGKYDPATRIFFMIKIGEVRVGPINGIFPKKATVANKTGKLLLATLGECLVGRVYDLDDMIDKRCWVEVERQITDDGPVSRVKKVIYPWPKAAATEHGQPGGNESEKFETKQQENVDDRGDMPF